MSPRRRGLGKTAPTPAGGEAPRATRPRTLSSPTVPYDPAVRNHPIRKRFRVALVPLALVALGGAVSAQGARTYAGSPPAVASAIDRFAPKAQAIVTNEAGFSKLLAAVPQATPACEQPLARGALAKVLAQSAGGFLDFTRSAEQGELALYPLSKLFPTHAAKSQYVASLDAVGTSFDALLAVAKSAQNVASDIGAGNCSEASGLASMDAGSVTTDIQKLNAHLAQLLAP
jgi:hypothetical protein